MKADRQLDETEKAPRLNWGDANFDFGDWIDNKDWGFFDDDDDSNDNSTIGWPNIGDGGFVDWVDFDWGHFDFDNFTWDKISWNSSGWDDFLSDMDFNSDIDFCAILESAVGIGRGFGIEGNCKCTDDSNENATDMNIGCSFKHQCFEGSPICTTVGLNYTMDDTVISVGTCLDFWNDTFPEICFSYSFDITGQESQTCDVEYDGNPCDCEIQDFCLQLNCSMYLPGAAMDTCQILETIGADDASSFLPDFPVFNEDYTQTFENIPWQALDWEHLDMSNFKLDQIDWGRSAESRRFGDIINIDSSIGSGLLCPVLEEFIGMSDEFSAAGGCNCKEDQDGFSLDCSFQDACVSEELCASVDLQFGFKNIGAVDTDVCINFTDDVHPETCIAFDIPIASSGSSPTCTATYGGNACTCSIDQEFCVSVDCSQYDPAAVVSTCQDFSLGGSTVDSFIPRFSLPGQDDGAVLTDGSDAPGSTEGPGSMDGSTGEENKGNGGTNMDGTSAASQVNQSLNSGAVAVSSAFATCLLVSIPFLLCLFWT